MLSSLIIENFKSYVKAVIPLASMTFLIGPNASGKSNALEAFRLLSWLAKGMRLDDIGRNIQNGDAHIRGRAADLFKDVTDVLTIGCHLDDSDLGWNELQIEIGVWGIYLERIKHSKTSQKWACNRSIPMCST